MLLKRSYECVYYKHENNKYSQLNQSNILGKAIIFAKLPLGVTKFASFVVFVDKLRAPEESSRRLFDAKL